MIFERELHLNVFHGSYCHAAAMQQALLKPLYVPWIFSMLLGNNPPGSCIADMTELLFIAELILSHLLIK
jgi:hypothetical protein